jgi:hypothetical protein
VSYLTAWPSPQLVMAAQQQATREWWQRQDRSRLFISELVLLEASRGDPDAAKRRLEAIAGISQLVVSPEARMLARRLVDDIPLPPKAEADAFHIAIAAVNRIGLLLTWNCRHISNPHFRYRIEEICRHHGFEPPVICSPLDLTQESSS